MQKVAKLLVIPSLFISGLSVAQSVRSELYFTEPEKLPKSINSDAEEVFLLFSRDSSTLYFVRQGHSENEGYKKNPDDQDIWYTRKGKNPGEYEPALDYHYFNNEFNNAVVGMSLDGNTVYLLNVYDKKHQLDKGICSSKRDAKGNWSKPTKVEIPNLKIEGDFWGFYVNPQENIMILSEQGPGTMGEEDLYVILKQPDGKWGSPVSLGPKINTSGFEISPYLSDDGYTLFWSSNGRSGGQGDADIYASFRTDDGWLNWSDPVNLGPKINSAGFDAYFIISANDCWWASNREGAASEIYHARAIEPEPIEDTVRTDPPPPPPPVVELPKEIPKLPQYIEVKLFFATNSSYIEPDAARVADSVIAIMKARPEVVAEVHSHADKRASDEYNKWLTKRRATRVIEYMIAKGIDRKRLTPNWYGKTQLAVECDPCTDEQLKASRRTVIKLSRIE